MNLHFFNIVPPHVQTSVPPSSFLSGLASESKKSMQWDGGSQGTLGGGLRTSRPTLRRAFACPLQVGRAVLSPPPSEPRVRLLRISAVICYPRFSERWSRRKIERGGESQGTLDGGWRTSCPTLRRAFACPSQVGRAVLSPPPSEPRVRLLRVGTLGCFNSLSESKRSKSRWKIGGGASRP